MRELLIPVLLHLAFLSAGAGVLKLAAVPGPAGLGLVGMAGLAYLCGVAVVGTVTTVFVTVGIPFNLRVVLGIALVLSLPIIQPLARHTMAMRIQGGARLGIDLPPPRPRSRERVAVAVVWSAAGLALAFGLLLVHTRPLGDWDAWAIWTLKAEFLVGNDSLPTEVFTSQTYRFSHPDYPILLPLLEAMHLRAIGRVNSSEIHVVMWLLLAAWLGGMAHLTRGVLRSAFAVPLLLAGATLLVPQLLSAYADAPVAMFLSVGALALGRWLMTSSRPDLVLAIILLGGAAGLKNEGILGACALLVAAAAALGFARENRPHLRRLILAGGVMVLLAILPWRLWLFSHHVAGDFRISDALNPVFLFERVDRLWPALQGLTSTLGRVASAAVFVPLAIALMICVRGPHWKLVRFYATASAIYLGALLWVYWISPYEINWHISTSVTRVYLGLAMICFVAVVHLSGVALARQNSGDVEKVASTDRAQRGAAASLAISDGGIERRGSPESGDRIG